MRALSAAATRLVLDSGLAREVVGTVECRAGGNNRVLRLDTDRGRFLAKVYFEDAADTRDRLRAETAFLHYATGRGLRCVPAPLASDAESGVALHEYVEGRSFTSESLRPAHLRQAFDFFRALNALPRPGAEALATASAGAFSVEGHAARLESRLSRLREIEGEDGVDAEARRFVPELEHAWDGLRRGLERAVSRRERERTLEAAERCVSPSDFGFHNALEAADGRVVFLDFEYAGWDDPAKAIGDFLCQPVVPVDRAWFEEAAAAFSAHAPDPRAMARRAAALLPLFWFEWCLIRLNEFTPVALRRRMFADPAIDVTGRKRERLRQAVEALAALPQVQEAARLP